MKMRKRLIDWLLLNRANFVTTIRLIASAWLIISAISDSQLFLMLVLVVICGLTDAADGWVARRYGIESRTGALLDRMADKFFVCPAILILVLRYWPTIQISEVVKFLTGGLVAVVLLLETLLIISGLIGWAKGLSIESNKWGKWKMALDSSAVFVWVLSLNVEYYLKVSVFPFSIYLIDVILISAIALTVKSIEGYFQRWQQL